MFVLPRGILAIAGFLTDRDRWAGTFDELLLDTPRTDTPMYLPDGPAPTGNWTPAPNGTDDGRAANANNAVPSWTSRNGEASAPPQHCSTREQTCHGPDAMTAKQRRLVELFSALTSTPSPDVASMSNYEASLYIRARWAEWISTRRGE